MALDFSRLKTAVAAANFGEPISSTLLSFFHSFDAALMKKKGSFRELPPEMTPTFEQYIDLISKELKSPTQFGHYHPAENSPFNFYEFSLQLVRPLIDFSHSVFMGQDHLQTIVASLQRGENVILLANHQTELDPQIISLMTAPVSQSFASSIIFVAGHRVTSDPLAVPFSRGTNLLCIYSKKYIDHPPEEKAAKLMHNAKTVSKLEELLSSGGACIYVAPSGGRDRCDETGNPKIAPFDPQSVEMFYLLSQKAAKKTNFHLLALDTMRILPPPQAVNIDLGEERSVSFSPVGLAFGPRLELSVISENSDRQARRIERAAWLTMTIENMHRALQP